MFGYKNKIPMAVGSQLLDSQALMKQTGVSFQAGVMMQPPLDRSKSKSAYDKYTSSSQKVTQPKLMRIDTRKKNVDLIDEPTNTKESQASVLPYG